MFLKRAMSLLKIDGMRTPFLGELPVCPKAARPKQATLITNLEPVGSAPVAPFMGSHRIFGRAFIWPPVKSVIIVQTVAEVWKVPVGQVCPELIAAVPL